MEAILNILFAGRAGRYADRLQVLIDLGHPLVYCTMPAPLQKPLPDDLKNPNVPQFVLERGKARAVVDRLLDEHSIDVVYSMKNVWDGSLELLEELLDPPLGVPIVRHYKEHFCTPSELERRTLTETAGQIYINEESIAYFREVYDVPLETAHILDTDYVPLKYMTDEFRPKLFERTREPHLLIAGGASVDAGRYDVRELCVEMTKHRVHVHLYGAKYVGRSASGVWGVGHEQAEGEYRRLAEKGYVHLHGHVEPSQFTHEWSVYDAGLLHPRSKRTGDPVADGVVEFERMNYPNRISPYLAAGLPLAQPISDQDAVERLVAESGFGFLFRDYEQLAERLWDRTSLGRMTDEVKAKRTTYSYEHHAPALIEILSRYAAVSARSLAPSASR